MKVFTGKDGLLVRLFRGEEIHASLTALARERGMRGAVVQGIGAVMDAEVGFYHLDRREYEHRTVDGITELLSLSGNLALRDGAPVLHAHVVLMRPDFSVAGGHLFRAAVAVTGEFALRQTDLDLLRRSDPGLGLPLLESGPSEEASPRP